LKVFSSLKTNLIKLKITKDTYAPSANKVLVMKNQFLFFEKGKKQVSKKTDSFLSRLLNDKSEIDNFSCFSILKRNNVYKINQQSRVNSEKKKSLHFTMMENESRILSQKAKYKEILKFNISPKETNFHYNKQTLNKQAVLTFQNRKKLVDPLKYKVEDFLFPLQI